MTPKFLFLGDGEQGERERKKESERARTHLLVPSKLWHSTEKFRPREKWRREDYDSGISTRLNWHQQNQSLTPGNRKQPLSGCYYLEFVQQKVGGQIRCALSSAGVGAAQIPHAPGEQTVHFLGQHSEVRILKKKYDNGRIVYIVIPKETEACVFQSLKHGWPAVYPRWTSVLAGRSHVSQCLKRITQLFVCSIFPINSLVLLLGKKSCEQSKHTHSKNALFQYPIKPDFSRARGILKRKTLASLSVLTPTTATWLHAHVGNWLFWFIVKENRVQITILSHARVLSGVQ